MTEYFVELIHTARGYPPENIVLMMHHASVALDLYPSQKNIVRISWVVWVACLIVERSCARLSLWPGVHPSTTTCFSTVSQPC
jgi:hypothetical protein